MRARAVSMNERMRIVIGYSQKGKGTSPIVSLR